MTLTFRVSILETIYTNTGWTIKLDEHPFQGDMEEFRKEINDLVKWCDENGLVNSNTSFASPKGCYWQINPYTIEIIIKKSDIYTAFNLTWMNTNVSSPFTV